MISEYAYDVAILDVMVPDGDGFSLCRELRATDQWVPILFLTARDAVDDRVQGLDAGGDDYLVKPFAFTELLARLRSLVRRGPADRAPALRLGDLELDPATHSGQGGRPTRRAHPSPVRTAGVLLPSARHRAQPDGHHRPGLGLGLRWLTADRRRLYPVAA